MLPPSHLLTCCWRGLGHEGGCQHPWKLTALKVQKGNWFCWSSSWALHMSSSGADQQIEAMDRAWLIALAGIRLRCVKRLHGNVPLYLEMGENWEISVIKLSRALWYMATSLSTSWNPARLYAHTRGLFQQLFLVSTGLQAAKCSQALLFMKLSWLQTPLKTSISFNFFFSF